MHLFRTSIPVVLLLLVNCAICNAKYILNTQNNLLVFG